MDPTALVLKMKVKRFRTAFKFIVPMLRRTFVYFLRKLLSYCTLTIFLQVNAFWISRFIGFWIASLELTSLLWTWFRSRKRQHFWIPETKTLPPACLVSSSIGRHRYVQLKVLKVRRYSKNLQQKPHH